MKENKKVRKLYNRLNELTEEVFGDLPDVGWCCDVGYAYDVEGILDFVNFIKSCPDVVMINIEDEMLIFWESEALAVLDIKKEIKKAEKFKAKEEKDDK
jgi:hypothetical protein